MFQQELQSRLENLQQLYGPNCSITCGQSLTAFDFIVSVQIYEEESGLVYNTRDTVREQDFLMSGSTPHLILQSADRCIHNLIDEIE